MASLRASFLTGIVVIAPVGLTVWLIWTVIGWVDGFVWPFVPQAYQPEALLNRFLGIRDASDPDWISVNVAVCFPSLELIDSFHFPVRLSPLAAVSTATGFAPSL